MRRSELSSSALEEVALECAFVHQDSQQTESVFGIIVLRSKILPGKVEPTECVISSVIMMPEDSRNS